MATAKATAARIDEVIARAVSERTRARVRDQPSSCR
jgi:hypothetical protein